MDYEYCGSKTDPCGTLYYVSMMINQLEVEEVIIYVIDGQNETEIIKYQNLSDPNNYDPCLPTPFKEDISISITFDAETINDLTDWYPVALCSDNNYSNEYIFDTNSYSLTVNHLIINNLYSAHPDDVYYIGVAKNLPITDTFYPFMRNVFDRGEVTCNNCSFMELISIGDAPLFYTMFSIYLLNNKFISVTTLGTIIYADEAVSNNLGAIRTYQVQDTEFVNVLSEQSFLMTTPSDYDITNVPTLLLKNCTLESVVAFISIIYDETLKCNVTISDTSVDIIHGRIYYSSHVYSSNININHISITTDQLQLYLEIEDALLHFSTADVVYINNIDYLYFNYIYENCWDEGTFYSVTHGSYDLILCDIPISFITNAGEVQISNAIIDTKTIPDSFTVNKYETLDYPFQNGFIKNYRKMSITNLFIRESISDSVVFNEGILSISNLMFDTKYIIDYNPNTLHSFAIIIQAGADDASTVVYNSNLIGSEKQLLLTGGTTEIFNCTFERANIAIDAADSVGFKMMNSIVKNNGQFYGKYVALDYDYDNIGIAHVPIYIQQSQNIQLKDNIFSGFDPTGILSIYVSSNISLINNTFNVDTTELYYSISDDNIGFIYPYSPLTLLQNTNITIIGNTFDENAVDTTTPWIFYDRNNGRNCLSGNTFNNYAFSTDETHITSCFRHKLINCIHHKDRSHCINGEYGSIDPTLYAQNGHFIVDLSSDIEYIMKINRSYVAMDYIDIVMKNEDDTNINNGIVRIAIVNGDLFVVDSSISMNYDIAYNIDSCSLIYNDRLNENENNIVRLMLHCSAWSLLDPLQKTRQSSVTTLVDQFSAVMIQFEATSRYYYPGALLHFEYNIMDIFHNIIGYNDSFTINLESEIFSILLEIDDEECVICDKGIAINVISLDEHVGDVYQINTFVEDNVFIAEPSAISINITACPQRFGRDSNGFTCIMCNKDYYNLLPNNVNECISCDPDNNIGIKCSEGNIYIEEGYWMGFDGDHIISSLCPVRYCCRKQNGCNYIQQENEDKLCALNRDHKSKLCGKCKDSYSESMNSTKCVKCTQKYYLQYLLLPIGLSLLISFGLMFTNMDKTESHKGPKLEITNKVKELLRNDNFQLMMKIMIFKNIFYYEQSVSQILSMSSVNILFVSFATFFNLSTTFDVSSSADPWCFIDGLNSKHKILIDLLIPVMMTVFIGFIYFFSKFIVKKPLQFKLKHRRVNFTKTLIVLYLMVIGKILDILFRLLNCQKVGDSTVHFYFGNEECYGITWILSLISLIVVVLSFSMIFVKIKKMSISERQNPKKALHMITSRYKPQFYYWEFVIFIRRIFIALFSVSINDITLKCVFVIISLFFIFLQYLCNPFIIHSTNNMEAILLLCLPFIIITQMLSSINLIFIDVMVSFLIILPFPLMIYFIYCVYRLIGVKAAKETEINLTEIKTDITDKNAVTSNKTVTDADDGNVETTEKVKEMALDEVEFEQSDNSSNSSSSDL